MNGSRQWNSGIAVMYRTIARTVQTLRSHRLGALVPVFGLLLLVSILVWAINSIAPLAPFVYSLF